MPFFTINTIDSPDFQYFPITNSHVALGVKASHDARISLRTSLGDDSNFYEIVIGGWGNTMSAIKRSNIESDVTEAETLDILSSEDQCSIWIKWCCDGWLRVGHNSDDIFMSYKDKDPFVINYIGFSTAWGATGEWILSECDQTSSSVRQQLLDTRHYWVDCNDTCSLPRNAVMASEDGLCIGRAHYKDAITPGGVRGMICKIPWGGSAHERKEFQMLCGKEVSWVKAWKGSVPLYALPGGETEDGTVLFIGRVFYEGMYYIGKIQPEHQVCYIPVDGHETPCVYYETLVTYDYPILEYVGR